MTWSQTAADRVGSRLSNSPTATRAPCRPWLSPLSTIPLPTSHAGTHTARIHRHPFFPPPLLSHIMATPAVDSSDHPLLDQLSPLSPSPIPLSAADVYFPPAELCDFVIHYRGTSYHVHKFLLCYHSSYFRAYIMQLKADERSYAASECGEHASVLHCIRVPDDVMEGCRCNTSDHFQLFLCHLYFAQHYCCPPYRHRTHLSLDGQPLPPISLNYPKLVWREMFPQLALYQPSQSAELPPLSTCVLSLAYYFDCAVLLEQCESNCLSFVHNLTPTLMQNNTTSVWTLFDMSSKYGMLQLKAACLPLMVNHRDGHYKGRWLMRQQQLDRDTLFEVVKLALKL